MEYWIDKPFAEIWEAKHVENINGVRAYISQAPDVVTLQIRTCKGIGEYGKGKPRNMIASVNITLAELEAMIGLMRLQYPAQETDTFEQFVSGCIAESN